MSRIGFMCVALASLVFFSGCSSRYGVKRLTHNGKPYYFDREICPRFYYKHGEDEIQCANEDGSRNGHKLYPMSEQAYQNYIYEKQVDSQNFQAGMQSLSNSLQQSAQNMQMQNMNNQMMFNNNLMMQNMMNTQRKGWY